MQSINLKSKEQKILAQARKMRGYLDKKSNNFFVGFQKRFFLIIQDSLVYFYDQTLQSPKGYIKIKHIRNIKSVGNSEFNFKYHDRVYYLKSNDTLNRDEWVKSLKIVNQYLCIISGSQIESTIKWKKEDKQKKLKDYTKIEIQNNKIKYLNNVTDKQKFNRSIFKTLSLNKIFQEYDFEKIKNRLLIKKFKQGTYFVLSCKSFNKIYEDELILPKQYIQPYDFNILYCLKPDQVQAKFCLNTAKITNIELIQDKYLKLNNTLLTLQENVDQFISNLNSIIQIGKQYHNQMGIQLKKNVDRILKIYSQCFHPIQRQTKLKFKFNDQLVKFIQKNNRNCKACNACKNCNHCQTCKNQKNYNICLTCHTDNYRKCELCLACKNCIFQLKQWGRFITIIQNLLKQLKNVINAFKVRKQSKKCVDIIKVYIEFMHGRVYKMLKNFWDENYKKLQSQEIMSLSLWLNQYYQLIKQHLKDIKIINGIKILNRIFFKKIVQQVEIFIKSRINSQDVFQFSVANTTKLPLQFCLIMEKKIKSIYSCIGIKDIKKEVQQFVNISYSILSDNIMLKVKNEKKLSNIIGLCNDVWMYRKQISYISQIKFKEVYKINRKMHDEILKKIIQIIQDQVMFDSIDILKQGVGNYFKICENILKVSQLHPISLRQFHQFNLESIIKEYFKRIINIIKIREKSSIINKTRDEIQNIKKLYKQLLQQSNLFKIVHELEDFLSFIQDRTLESFQKSCIQLKQGLFSQLMTIQIIQVCVIYKYDDDNQKIKEATKIYISIFLKSQPKLIRLDSIFTPQVVLNDGNSSRSRISTLTKSLSSQLTQKTIFQGYLESKQNMKIQYEQKYYRLYEDKLNCYSNYNNQQILYSINLNEIKKIYIDERKSNKFRIQLINGLKYKFKAQSNFQSKQWSEQIHKHFLTYSNYLNLAKIQNNQDQLFLDYFSTKQTQNCKIQNTLCNQSLSDNLKLIKSGSTRLDVNQQKLLKKQNSKPILKPKIQIQPNQTKWYQIACIKLQ